MPNLTARVWIGLSVYTLWPTVGWFFGLPVGRLDREVLHSSEPEADGGAVNLQGGDNYPYVGRRVGRDPVLEGHDVTFPEWVGDAAIGGRRGGPEGP